jgi:hypothetical protein
MLTNTCARAMRPTRATYVRSIASPRRANRSNSGTFPRVAIERPTTQPKFVEGGEMPMHAEGKLVSVLNPQLRTDAGVDDAAEAM